MFSEFSEFRKYSGSEGSYKNFVFHTIQNWEDFFLTYSVLARLLSQRTIYWCDAVSEMLTRLSQDAKKLSNFFDLKEEPINCTSITIPWSDSHDDARFLVVLHYINSISIVYKPRPIEIGRAFNELLSWLKSNTQLLLPSIIRTLPMSGYGYIEYINQDSTKPTDDYFTRCGSLLFLLYILSTTDCHYENLMCFSNSPILIDTETILTPEHFIDSDAITESERYAGRIINNSVLRTGFLPGWSVIPGQKGAVDISGFRSYQLSANSSQTPIIWSSVNTDSMMVSTIPSSNTNPSKHTTFEDKQQVDAVCQGFSDAYNFFTSNKELLFESNDLFNRFLNLNCRIVFRPTNVYWRLLLESLSPLSCQSGIDRSILLDKLALAWTSHKVPAYCALVIQQEHESLSKGDIPYFLHNTSSLNVYCVNADNHFEALKESSFDSMLCRVSQLDKIDLEFQVQCIRASFASVRIGAGHSQITNTRQRDIELSGKEEIQLDKQKLTKHISEIVRHLDQRSIVSSDSSISWIGLDYDVFSQSFRMAQLDPITLYSGSGGIALFFAAYSKINEDSKTRSIACNIADRIQSILCNGDNLPLQVGGYFTGHTGAAVTLFHIGEILNERDYVMSAVRIIEDVTDDLISNDTYLDVISGSSGAIIAINTILAKTKNEKLKNIVLSLALHILKEAHHKDNGALYWKNVNLTGCLGLAHGNSGFALALALAYKITGVYDFAAKALAAIKFEDNYYNSEFNDWEDSRSPKGSLSFAGSWCHGAPGIALSRMYLAKLLSDNDLGTQASKALLACTKTALISDHTCCGLSGVVEALLIGARWSENNKSEQYAKSILAKICERSYLGFMMSQDIAPATNILGFMQGVSGIGYTMLRYLDPELPSILSCGLSLQDG